MKLSKCPSCGHARKPRRKPKPSTNRVLWVDGSSLYVREYSNKNGRIHAWVENGGWALYINTLTKTFYAKRGREVVTKHRYKKLEEVIVSRDTCKKLTKYHGFD